MMPLASPAAFVIPAGSSCFSHASSDMIVAGKHVPLPALKPKVLQLAEINKHNKGKVDSAPDEDWPRQIGARKPPPRDCAVDCGHKSAVAIMNKHLPTTSQGPTGGNRQQRQQQDR